MSNIEKYLKDFNLSQSDCQFTSKKYDLYIPYINTYKSGEGMVGNNSYLSLWEKEEIEELNEDYAVDEFIDNCILIGSDGADIAYGINKDGYFISVPFIGMDNDEIKIIGHNFEEFLCYLFNV